MRHIVLLRGINLGPRNRIPMRELAQLLTEGGMGGVRTHLQSGNVLLDRDSAPAQVAADVRRLIGQRFGLQIDVLVRTRDELAVVVEANPLAKVAGDPRRYQVTFLERELDPAMVDELTGLAAGSEQLVAIGRELYAWHPRGVARSKLWQRVASRALGAPATTRNWSTVSRLLELADERAPRTGS